MMDDFGEFPEAFYDAFEDMLRHSLSVLIRFEPDAQKFIDSYTHLALTDCFDFFDYLDTGNQDEKRKMARMFAIQIWNNAPLPSNHYRPKPLIQPKRNEPCFCGSGKKYKSCCVRLKADSMPMMDLDLMSQYLLEVISKTELKQVWQYLPHPLLSFIAKEWTKEGQEMSERGLLMLDPIFKQEDAKLDHRDEPALDTMAEICTILDKPRKKNALLKRFMQHPDKCLQAAALHRQCCILGDQGKYDEAWLLFQKAQRLDPNNPSLSHLEILLLMQQGKIEQMQQRGRYWIKRLGSMNQDGNLDDLIDIIQAMISDAPTAMGQLMELDTPGAARLIAWLKAACKKPPTLISKLQSYDDVCVIEPKNKRVEKLEYDWNNLFITHDDPWDEPDDWLDMLEAHPELGGSIMVIDDLVRFVQVLETPNPILTFEPLLMLAMLQIKDLLPQTPEVPLAWEFMENRPALRLLGFLAGTMNDMEDYQTAIEMMEWILRLNPNDNQGYRSELVNVYLEQGLDLKAIELCDRYPEDFDVSICFGHALALFRQGKRQQADAQLKKAIKQFPKVPNVITRKTIKQPKDLRSGLIKYGGEDEAWYYRQSARDFWVNTPEAIAWMKQCLKKVKPSA